MPVTGLRAALAAAALLSACGAALPQAHWDINSPASTGAVAPHRLRDEPGVAPRQDFPTLAQAQQAAPQAAAAPVVDESALRYFARQGDQRRLEIEIARLRALYPNWTPPADPLSVPANVDERIEALWRLYAEGRLAEARAAIAERQAGEPAWQPPADLIDRLNVAEARERLVNASDLRQYETVIRVASENPSLLTCTEVDVLWRVADAFALTERPERARDAFRYVLTNCDNAPERLATMQKAVTLLSGDLVQELLALERFDADRVGEFAGVRDDLARNAVSAGAADGSAAVAAEQVTRLEGLARSEPNAADALLLGWYNLRRDRSDDAETWFRRAKEIEDGAEASQGLALALMARGRHAEAEAVAYPWRGADEENRSVYLAAVANLLGIEPRVALQPEILERIVAETASARDVASARQLGWYARAFNQFETAGRWFSAALSWDPDDEPSAYGLALTRHQLGDRSGLAELKRLWAGRSERIQQVGEAAPRGGTAVPRAPAEVRGDRPAPARSAQAERRDAPQRSCSTHVDPATLSATAALERGWCLLDANRPLAAAAAFEAALKGSAEATRRDAAWGASLAYLRAELVDEAAVAATAAPNDARRAYELQSAILAQRAAAAFEHRRYVDALIALDQRARLAPERVDLMVLRGYAYLNLGRRGDALRVFGAAAATGNRDALRGLADAQVTNELQ